MQPHVKPPVLISRIMTFVFAATLVMTVVLGYTLYNMFPLNRPQIFILQTVQQKNQTIKLDELPPVDENYRTYLRAFIREYVKARNEIVSDTDAMRAKWGTGDGALVRAWSSDDVFADFQQTDMWNAMMNDVPDFEFECPVEFSSAGAIVPRGNDTYAVNFSYFCRNNNGQIAHKDYTIVLTLDTDNNQIRWSQRLDNPLGVRVTGYTVESGPGDPLDTGYLSTGNE